jgi:hypothetical protein
VSGKKEGLFNYYCNECGEDEEENESSSTIGTSRPPSLYDGIHRSYLIQA